MRHASPSPKSRFPKVPKIPVPPEEVQRLRDVAARVAREGDAAIDFSDLPEMSDAMLANARRRGRPRSANKKIPVTLRVDADVITWFRTQGNGYQTRINTALRRVMERSR